MSLMAHQTMASGRQKPPMMAQRGMPPLAGRAPVPRLDRGHACILSQEGTADNVLLASAQTQGSVNNALVMS